MNEKSLNELLATTKITEDIATKLAIKYKIDLTTPSEIDATTQTRDKNTPSKTITYIEDICIPVLNPNNVKSSHVIGVASTRRNLKRIALGLAANRAICLLGIVGSGKTCLVEFLAAKTGRAIGDSFVKVQLGDQTDSKMLLGTYRCTDVPGEFIWQPGVLTQVGIFYRKKHCLYCYYKVFVLVYLATKSSEGCWSLPI